MTMPARTYRGSTVPPHWWEKALAHPVELVCALMGGVFGLMLLVGVLWPSYDPSPPIAALAVWMNALLGCLLLVGASSLVVGLIGPMPDIEAEWIVERLGLALSGIAWAAYAVAVYATDPGYGGALVLGWGLSLSMWVRLATTYVVQRGVKGLMRRDAER